VTQPLSIPVTCTSCANTDLPWWQVGILTVVGGLIAYGLLWGLARLLTPRKSRRGQAPTARRTAPPTAPAGPPQAAAGLSRYRTVAMNRELRYALEIDERTGGYYVTIPVSNRMVDYEEAYEVDRVTFERYRADPASALDFVTHCRNHELDHLLRERPGADRGTPS
jgi:hypothetical protein